MITFITGVMILGMFSGLASGGEQTYPREDLEKALDIVRRIEEAATEGGTEGGRKVKVTEDVLNAYLAYQAALEGGPLKSLQVKIFPQNMIEGKLFIDLSGANPPKGLRPEMTFYFRSKIEIRDGKGRLDIKELFLEKHRVEPVLLDLALLFMAKIQNTETTGMADWYDLPLGITGIKTHKGWGEIYY